MMIMSRPFKEFLRSECFSFSSALLFRREIACMTKTVTQKPLHPRGFGLRWLFKLGPREWFVCWFASLYMYVNTIFRTLQLFTNLEFIGGGITLLSSSSPDLLTKQLLSYFVFLSIFLSWWGCSWRAQQVKDAYMWSWHILGRGRERERR